MSYLIAVISIILTGAFPADTTSGYDPYSVDLTAAHATACAIGTLHPDTTCRK